MRECEELLKCVQRSRDSQLDLAGGLRLQAARLMHTCQACQKMKRRASCLLQDKSPRLAKPFGRGSTQSRGQVARIPCLAKYDFSHSFSPYSLSLYIYIYIYPYTHDSKRASRENFERETLEKTRLIHPQSLPKRLFKFLYYLPFHCKKIGRASCRERVCLAV